MFQQMLAVLSRETGVPADTPFDQLSARQRRIILHGTDEQWFTVPSPDKNSTIPLFRFQYKGLYPALEEAAKLSPGLRGQWEHLVDEVECSTCGGSRLARRRGGR